LNDSKPPVSGTVEVTIDKLHEDLYISHAANVETYPTRLLIVGRGGGHRRVCPLANQLRQAPPEQSRELG
jgi:hypothetical protein